MSEVKFTNEVWQWEHDNETACTISVFNSNGVEICRLQSETNAHLIAAAPEMYAMLEEVAKELYNLIDEVNDQRLSHVHASSLTQPDLHDGETIHNIQLLLSKARGQ